MLPPDVDSEEPYWFRLITNILIWFLVVLGVIILVLGTIGVLKEPAAANKAKENEAVTQKLSE